MTCYDRKKNPGCAFLKSKDGKNWKDVFAGQKIENYLTCETDFIFKDNYWYFVCRNEFGKFGTYGTEVYKFDVNGNLITYRHFDIKMDGPSLFENEGKLYLVARRNLANGGRFLLPCKIPDYLNYLISKFYYGFSAKKTSIWRLDETNLDFVYETDLPSSGDTSYACVLQKGGKTKIFYYSNSPVKNPPWILGQFSETSIYSVEVV